jgi:hypothetical protein
MTVGRIPVIEGGIQPTIFDAKADLLTATANDTPARLAVGANDTLLVADSTAATGLAWKTAATQFPWISFTPTLNNMTLGNGTVTARYQQIGNTVFVYFTFTLGSTSAIAANPYILLPVGSANGNRYQGVNTYLDAGTNLYGGRIELFGGQAYFLVDKTSGTYLEPANNLSATVPFTWASTDNLTTYFWYEVA